MLTIYEAAAEVFVREGYAGATGKVLAAAAEVAESTLFRLVGDKESLYVNLFDYAWAEINAGISDALYVPDLDAADWPSGPADAIVADGEAIATMFDDERRRPLVTFAFDALGRELERFSPKGSLSYNRFRQRMVNNVTLFQRHRDHGGDSPPPPDAVADGLIARLRGTWMAWHYTPTTVVVRRPTVDELAQQLRADLGMVERAANSTGEAAPADGDEARTGERAAS